MFLLYGVVQILQAVAPDFLNIMCHVSENYFMNNLDYASAVKSGHVWQKNARRNTRDVTGCVRWEGAGLEHNARCGLVAGMKVIGQVFLPREIFHCPLYSEKEGLCRVETYLIGTGLKTKGFGVYCARLESPNISTNISFHSGLKPTDVVFLISHLQALIPDPYWLINHPSLCYVIAMRTEMILRKLERSDRQTCFGTFIEEDTRQQDKQLIES